MAPDPIRKRCIIETGLIIALKVIEITPHRRIALVGEPRGQLAGVRNIIAELIRDNLGSHRDVVLASPDFSVRPNGADHQWGKDPPM